MSEIITNLLDRKKGGACQICGTPHSIQNRCASADLIRVVTKLREANSFIPQILQANKEATELATHFQDLLKIADKAHIFLMETLTKHGDIGEQIKNEYLGELDSWTKQKVESTNQDTSEQLPLFNQESSTPSETSDKLSTTTESGEISPKNS